MCGSRGKPSNRKRLSRELFEIRLKQTLEDGVFYETCEDAMENWDEDWVVCPVCQGYINIEREDGLLITRVEHKVLDRTKH